MVKIPPYPSTKTRRVKRKPTVTPPTALVITGIAVIYYDEGQEILYVEPTLNTSEANPLVNLASANPQKWMARYQGQGFAGISITQTTANQIEIQFESTGGDAGPDTLTYLNNPSDIEDESGRTLAAFEMVLA